MNLQNLAIVLFFTAVTVKSDSDTDCSITSCPKGTFRPLPSEDCIICPAGYWCPSSCIWGNPPVICQQGYYCPEGSFDLQPCPPGTVGYQNGLTDFSECTICEAGLYCKYSGAAWPSGRCPAGTYCPEGSTSPTACPVGYHCIEGSPEPTACPPGTFSIGASGPEDCIPCTPGHYCSEQGSVNPTGACQPGYYCTEGSSVPNPSMCPMGSYCPGGASAPIPCPPGTFGYVAGLTDVSECFICPAEFYCSDAGATDVTGRCDPGYYCPAGSVSQTMCPEGFYCPPGSPEPTACPPGTFSDVIGASAIDDCIPCTPGQYCSPAGLVSPTGACQPGYFCTGGSTVPTQNICSMGSYCPAGSAAPLTCPEGSSSPSGSSSVTDCALNN